MGGSEFIWAGNTMISSNGKYFMVVGCIWGCPYEWKLYDTTAIVFVTTHGTICTNKNTVCIPQLKSLPHIVGRYWRLRNNEFGFQCTVSYHPRGGQ